MGSLAEDALTKPRREAGPAGAGGVRRLLASDSLRLALLLFVGLRLLLWVWPILVLAVRPLPGGSDEVVRPYLGEPRLDDGWPGLLLGPWQRFDTQHYLRIARQGYAEEADSVFPPLYSWAIRGLGALLERAAGPQTANLLAALLLSNLAFVAAIALFYHLARAEIGRPAARRATVYLALFPTGFFLLAGYTESLFLLWALAAVLSARRGRFWLAGAFALLATWTRLTGAILILPLAYEFLRQRPAGAGRQASAALAVSLPGLGTAGFLLYRAWLGLPALGEVYRQHWFQATGVPGADLLRALAQMFAGGAPFSLYFDFLCALLLLITSLLAVRRLGATYGLYALGLLGFMLLPTSLLKPLYSFSRYALAFFPTFMLLGIAGRNPWLNRLILYPSLALYLYFSGQFFMWGWVA
ncbi:MAG: mannosyltransferase family protein [Candidatus Promineifilaceae bacterium]